MSTDDRLVALIDEIYALIKDPSGLKDLVERIADCRGADMALFTAPPLPGCAPVPLMTYKMDFTPVLARPDLLMRPEFTSRAVATGRAPGVFTLDELMSPQEQETNEYWQSVLAPLGIASGMLALVRTPEDNMRPVSLNLFRRATSRPFDAEDVQAMAVLFPHLRRTLSVLLDARAGLMGFEPDTDFSALNTPVFLLDHSAKVVRRNEAAERLLKMDDGLALRSDRLTLHDSNAQRDLDAALARVIGDDWSTRMRIGADLSAPRPSGLPALSLVAIPAGADNPIATAAASVRCLVFVYGELRAPDRTAPRDTAAWSLRN
ncbi:MAG: hypothetical protein ABL871_07705 [Terricaulis sp.]